MQTVSIRQLNIKTIKFVLNSEGFYQVCKNNSLLSMGNNYLIV